MPGGLLWDQISVETYAQLISITHIGINDTLQWLTGPPATQVVQKGMDHAPVTERTIPGNVRAELHTRMLIQPMPGRQWLGADHIERSTSDLAAVQPLPQRIIEFLL